ncbi:alpha/beta hydrolase [Arcanobacterium ihumii]|uniref:alpha/beta hydrolase n=1 Tax=Arcanobacterium ihumii TaxID=2138162 RepID=UPI000F541FB9|nr:alpha/beta hydrolase-fold protein [Arcanobacterium ihumii]
MAPNSLVIVLTSWAIVVAIVLASAWLLRRRKVVSFAATSVFTSIFLCLSIMAQINFHGGYMKSWSEVREFVGGSGTTQSEPQPLPPMPTSFDGAAYKATFTEISDPTLRGSNFSGHFMETLWKGPQSQIQQKVRVWAPEGWQKMFNLNVVVLLHGFPSNPHLMSANLQIPSILPELQKSGIIGPTIVVMPELRPDSREPDCVNIKGRPAVGTWVMRDIVGLIQKNFPVSHDRMVWSLGGISAGAYCAGVLGTSTSDVFGNLLLFSGYDEPLFGGLKKMPHKEKADFVISKLIPKVNQPTRILATSSGSDVDAMKLLGRLAKIKSSNVELELDYGSHGGHNWGAWSQNFKDSMYWLNHKKIPSTDHTKFTNEGESGWGIVPVYLSFAAFTVIMLIAVALYVRFAKQRAKIPTNPRTVTKALMWATCIFLSLGVGIAGTLWLGAVVNIKMETVQSFEDFAPLGRLIGIL